MPVDWKVTEDTVMQPDNLVVCYKATGKYISKAPSVIFEILSKSTTQKDTHLKYELYEKEGVLFYIIVDPEDEVAKVNGLGNGKDKDKKSIDATDELVDFDLGKCGIAFYFSKIWGWSAGSNHHNQESLVAHHFLNCLNTLSKFIFALHNVSSK